MASIGQVVLKAGMSAPTVLDSLAKGFGLSTTVSVLLHPLVVLGLGLYVGAALVWLLVLARIDVSLAYPFVGLGFILTMVLGWAVHGEILNAARVAGTLMIACGVVFLVRD
jgi:drug/metabolite transporter (DMT)-like permease